MDLTAAQAGFRTVRLQGVQIFAGQVTLAQPEMIPETEEDRDVVNPPIVIPEHSLFTGDEMCIRDRVYTDAIKQQEAMMFMTKKQAQLLLLAAGVLMLLFGLWRGEADTVFSKAIRLCMECVGIG